MLKRTMVVAAILAVGLIAGGTGIGMAAQPPDPTPGATQPVREQNLDADGLIRVHEQGVADVNVTNDPLNVSVSNDELNVTGEVEVSNFPTTQDVNVVGGSVALPPVTTIWSTPLTIDFIPAGESVSYDFPLMNAVSVSMTETSDEFDAVLGGPLGVPLSIESDDQAQETYFYTFTYPVPVDGVTLGCFNESDDCTLDLTITGFEVP